MTTYPHGFEGVITRFGVGKARKIWYKVLFLPESLAAELPFAAHPRLRVEGEIADVPMAGAFLPTGDGRRYIIVSPAVCQGAGVEIGSLVEMRFRVDDQDRVDIPAILAAELRRDAALLRDWEALTPGRRRGLVHPIHAARSDATRQRRLGEAIAAIRVRPSRTP